MRHLLLLLLLASTLAWPAAAAGTDWVIVTRKAGGVASRQSASQTWVPIQVNRRLGSGDWTRTEAGGLAAIRFSDGTVVGMGASTTVQISQVLDAAGMPETTVSLPRGGIRAAVARSLRRPRFEVTTPNAVLAAQGTDFLVDVTETPGAGGEPLVSTRAAVREGLVRLTTPATGQSVLLKAGDSARVDEFGSVLLNPPGFTWPDALREFRAEHGVEGAEAGGAEALEHGTVFEAEGSGTGLGGIATEPGEFELEDGSPVLVNPNETTGTGGIRIHIPGR